MLQKNDLIPTIKNSNKIWSLIKDCEHLLQPKIKPNRYSIRKHLKNLVQYVISEQLNINIKMLEDLRQNDEEWSDDLQPNDIEPNELLTQELSALASYLESKRDEIYQQAETILKLEKGIANIPEILEIEKFIPIDPDGIKAALIRNEEPTLKSIIVTVERYPLLLALDEKIVELLLKYEANPNLRSYAPFMEDPRAPIEQDCCIPLKVACLKGQIHKAIHLISFTQDKDAIEDSLNHLLLLRSSNPEDTKLTQLLANKVQIEFILDKLSYEIRARQVKKEHLESIPEGDYYENSRKDCKNMYDFINNTISILEESANQKLSYPIWIILKSGFLENGTLLNTLPIEVITLFINQLWNTNFYELLLEKINPLLLEAFKFICISLMDNGFQSPKFAKLFDVNSENSINKSISIIRRLCSDRGIAIRSRLLIAQAWQLAHDSYETLSPQHMKFLELMENAKTHSTIETLKKIHTIMTKYDPKLASYAPLNFEEYEYKISKNDIGLLNLTDAELHFYYANHCLDLSYKQINLNIDKTIKNHKQNKIEDTEIAKKLADKHHCKFNSKNIELVRALTQWAVGNKQKNTSFLERFTTHVDTNAIKIEIIKDIDDLNKNKKIIAEEALSSKIEKINEVRYVF